MAIQSYNMENLNSTPSSERVHIAVFGNRNAGKSSLINAITGQSLSIVSDFAGTTTDPVYKTMEILPLGPVVLIDTPGIDDDSELGAQRVEKTREILGKCDIALLVVDILSNVENDLISEFKESDLPYIVVFNKVDLFPKIPPETEMEIYVSARDGTNISRLREKIANLPNFRKKQQPLIEDLVSAGDFVLLVTPQDESAPKGRLILPQQQTIRAILDAGAVSIVINGNEIEEVLSKIKQPKIVITDSQIFGKIAKFTPNDILLTSFSILFARYRGTLESAVKGATVIDNLRGGETILISEACTHHRQCNDIGTVKLPNLIRQFTGKNFNFEWTAGRDFPENPTKYALIAHCGGCMLNDKEMQRRYNHAAECGVPITNYGILIAYMNGILERSLRPFAEIHKFII